MKYFAINKVIVIIIISLFLSACSKKPGKEITPAVFHWKTIFNLSSDELNWLNENHINKIYLRVFDVDWNNDLNLPLPKGDVQILTTSLKDKEIIPVVFITNRTFLNLPDSSINSLAINVVRKVTSKEKYFKNSISRELQFDCDWTEKTRVKYFNFIKAVKLIKKPINISATIRMHQVKYFDKTGVPPVDRGMLMFYNMSPVEDPGTINSIFNTQTAKKYLFNFDRYPLKLDLVLPAFSWGALFRNGKLINLINDLKEEEITVTGKFYILETNRYRCKSPVFIHGIRIENNDMIRLEIIDTETTESAASLISGYLKDKRITVALYHLNKEVTKKYEPKILQNIYSHFN
jgi:hypothetical protein